MNRVALTSVVVSFSALLGCVGAPAAPPPVDRILVVFKTHFDLGYTDFATNVVRRYRTTMIDEALKVVDQNRDLPPEQQFVWTLPGWPMKTILEDWPGRSPDRNGRVLEALRAGRFVVHALPFTTHTELLEAEDLVRGLGFSSRLARSIGLALPRDAKMTDVPCHSWILPTLLRNAGVDFLHLGCNAASRSPQVPRLFWWEGPDGSRLLTMYTAESYGTGLVPPPDWPCRTWLALIHTGDNHGPPTPEEVRQLREEAKAKLPGVSVRIGRLSDFADAVLAEKPALPIIRGDMPDTWIHGPLCDPSGAKLARNLRPAIALAESLDTELRSWGLDPPAAKETIARAYEQSLLYGEHTWGGALYWVSEYTGGKSLEYGAPWRAQRAAGHFSRLEASWAEHTAYIESAEKLLQPVLDERLHALAQAVAVEGRRIAVFNPLPWPRDGLVTLDRADVAFAALRPADERDVVPLEVDGRTIRFLARNVPALGYRTYVPVPAAPRAPSPEAAPDATRLESPFFSVTLDPARGVIRSLIDRRSGREWVDSASRQGLGQCLYERFDNDQVQAYVKAYVKITAAWATNELGKPNLPPAAQVPYRATSPRFTRWHAEHTPVAVAAVLEAPAAPDLPHPVTARVVLYRDLPCVDLAVTLHDKPADPWPEAGWLCLPFKIDQPHFRLGRLGSLIDPARDIVPGANRHLFAVNTGLMITGADGAGLGICPIDHPLVSLDEPGCWRFSTDFVPKRPVAFVNVFNNQWTTNFRLWNEGTWTSRVRLWAIPRSKDGVALVTPAAETRLPLQAAMTEGAAGELPLTQRGLELSRKGVLVTAFGPNPDGEGVVLRLWEQAGWSGKCQVRLPAGLSAKSVQPVDLRGRPTDQPIPVRRGRFTVPLRAFAPASFLLGPALTAPSPADQELARRILADRDLDDVLERAKVLLKTGFNAGSGYREVWIRDFATFIALSCQVLDPQEIKENLRMFFRLQGDDGNIVDGFVHKSQANVSYDYVRKPTVPDYWGHKNTVETDQESSLVQAVHTYVRRTGDTAFLRETIDGRTVLDRLDLALEYLRQNRFSATHGLLWGATTVDWGDVQPEHDWGVVLDANSHRAIDVYDNAMFLIALSDFVALAGPGTERARRWEPMHRQVKADLRTRLWDARRQKFRPHLYLEGSPFPPGLDEDQICYHGGTAVAILAGVLTRSEVAASLDHMRRNVRAAGAGSLGLTVYPPYPAGTFKNRSMGPHSYQNGGDWDWFGGRMIQALVDQGFVAEAYEELLPMVRRVQQHNGFYEWWDLQNHPRGSATFRGAAGVLGQAIEQLRDWARKTA